MTAKDDKQFLLEPDESHTKPAEEFHNSTISDSRKCSKNSIPSMKKSFPDYFGVRSYLHNFYETTYKDPSIYEDDFRFLLHNNPRKRRCPRILWKICMWLGVNMLIFGIMGILVGYLVPQKSIFVRVDERTSEGYVDRHAMSFNNTLDVCKLIGLILFCIGGITLAMALLLPSFLTSYCDDDQSEENFKVKLDGEETAPLSPVDMKIPKSTKVKSVQPLRTIPEAVITQEGVVEYND